MEDTLLVAGVLGGVRWRKIWENGGDDGSVMR